MKRLAKATLVNALILFSIGGVAAFLFSTGMVEPRFVTSYWFGITSQSGLTLIVSAGIAAVGGAIEGARLSSLKINTLPRNRSAFEITLRALTPVLLAAILIQFVSFFSLSRFSPGAADTPNFALLFVFLLILIFHLLLGFNLGLRIHPALAIPIALTASYMWLGASWGVNFYPLRYMAGLILVDCCRIYEQLDASSVYTSLIFNGIGAVASFLFAARRIRGRGNANLLMGIAAGLLATTAALASTNAASALGPLPVTNRDRSSMRCLNALSEGHALSKVYEFNTLERSLSPYICFFDGQDPRGEFDTALRSTWHRLSDLGFDPPKLIVGTNQQNDQQQVGVVATPVSTPEEVAYSLVADIVGQPAICDQDSDRDWANREFTYRALINFLLTASSSPNYELSGFSPSLSEIERANYRNLEDASQVFLQTDYLDQESRGWLMLAKQSVQSCGVPPPVMP